MKKLTRFLITGLLFFTVGFNSFAEEPNLKFDSNKIIVVGKVNVIYDEDREFIYNTRNIPETLIESPDTYIVPYISDPNETWWTDKTRFTKENQIEYPIGDFFIVQYNIPKKGEKILQFRDGFSMNFYSSIKASIDLPLPFPFDLEIADNAFAIYIGTYNYYITGDDFTIVDIEIVDEYEQAQEELDRALETHCDLIKSVLQFEKGSL